MKKAPNIHIFNFVILLIYTTVILSFKISSGIGYVFILAICISMQAFINFAVGMWFIWIKNEPNRAPTYLSSAGMVLLIGFSACWGGIAIDTL